MVVQRMPHAGRLLRDTEPPVSRIAEMAGYRCIGSLSEMFRKHTGMKPTEYGSS
ncbi:MAG: helix-turn-helix domain-containing protein [Fretibacterium sp.]